jgi:phosphoenolpyruvate carboxykinase (ATP)
LQFPTTCPNVPTEILNPRSTWADKDAYDAKANDLGTKFIKNFEQYISAANDAIKAAAPKVSVNA